jgi:hypothetical protein
MRTAGLFMADGAVVIAQMLKWKSAGIMDPKVFPFSEIKRWKQRVYLDGKIKVPDR